MATRLGKRPNPKNYATYDPRGKARYRKDLAEYLKKKAAIEKEKNQLSTKKNLDKQKTANKKASTTTKAKAKGTTTVKPKATATKAKSLATKKSTTTTKAVEPVKVTTTKRKAATPKTKKAVTKKPTAKKPVAKKPVTKKPVAKKPVAKKPPARKPTAKKPPARKPTAKKPAGKVPAKKPLLNAKQKLRIKKGLTTTKNIIKKGLQKGNTILKNQKAKFTAKDQTPQQAIPEGKSKGAKFAKKINQKVSNYAKRVYNKAALDTFKFKTIMDDPSKKKINRAGIRGGVLSGGALLAGNALINRLTKPKGMTFKEWEKKKAEMEQKGYEQRRKLVVKTGKKIKNLVKTGVNKIRGKSDTQTSTTKNINKQKQSNNTGLKIKKTQYSSKKNTNKDYNAKTATKKRNTALSEFRVDPKANRKLQLEAQNKKPITYSRQLSTEAKDQISNTKNNKKKKTTRSSFNEKFIKGKGNRLFRRGTVTARRAENKEKARKRAQEAARKRRLEK